MLQASKTNTHTHTHTLLTHTLMHMLILQGMGEFRASLISSATAYHPEPERVGKREIERERERLGKVVGGCKLGEGGERFGRMSIHTKEFYI